jgi:hypothetical protein
MRGLGISSRGKLHRVVRCCWFMGHEDFRGGRFVLFGEMCKYILLQTIPLLPRESVVTRHMVSPHYPHIQAARTSNNATMMSGKQIQWLSCRLLINRLLHVAILEQRVSRRIQRPPWNVQLCKVREGVDDDGDLFVKSLANIADIVGLANLVLSPVANHLPARLRER